MNIQSVLSPEAESQLAQLLYKCYVCEHYMKIILKTLDTLSDHRGILDIAETFCKKIIKQSGELRTVFSRFNFKEITLRCASFQSIWLDGCRAIEQAAYGSSTRNMMIMITLQQMIHYKISNYGTIATFYRIFGNYDIVEILDRNLIEEKECYAQLTVMAATKIFQPVAFSSHKTESKQHDRRHPG